MSSAADAAGDGVDAVDVTGVELPELDATPRHGSALVPAAALAGLLAGIRAEDLVDDGEVLELAAGFQRLVAWAEAGLLAALAEFSRRPVVAGPAPSAGLSGRAGVGQVGREFAADEVAARLGLSVRAADRRIAVAVALAGRLPRARAGLARGRIDYPRAVAIVEETAALGAAEAGRVEEVVLAGGPRASVGRLRQACRRAVVSVDPAAADRRCRQARAERRVWAGPVGDGVGIVEAFVPVEHAAAVDAAVTAAATAWARLPGERRTMDQLRADALVAPFLRALETGVLDGAEPVRLARRHGRLPGLHLHLHPDTLAGADHRAAELRGFGPIPAALGRALAASAQSRHPVEQGLPTGEGEPGPEPGYRPSRALAEHVEQRDRTCRFPGCWRRADGCDLDHTRPHPAGATQAGNLGVLCRRHHRFKHSPGVHLDQPRPGHFHWHLPTGHHYTVDPPET